MAGQTVQGALFKSEQFLAELQSAPHNTIKASLIWFMWESSSATIARVGMPTDEDAERFKLAISKHPGLSEAEKKNLCFICDDYINSGDD